MKISTDKIIFTIEKRQAMPTYKEMFAPVFNALEELGAGQAIRVEVPEGKRSATFRTALNNAAIRRGVPIATAIAEDGAVWIRKREGK